MQKKIILFLAVFFFFSGGFIACDDNKSTPKGLTTFKFEKSLNSALFEDAVGVISELNNTKIVSIQVSDLVDVSGLVTTFTINGASLAVAGTLQVSGTTANDFSTPIAYTVTDENGTTYEYTVNVEQVNLRLNSLSLSEGTLSPVFAGDTTAYSTTVYDTSGITVTAAKASSDDEVLVSGTGVKSLSPGTNELVVTVTNKNQDNAYGATQEYKVTVTARSFNCTWTYDYINTAPDPDQTLTAFVTMTEGTTNEFVRISKLSDGTLVFNMKGDLAVNYVAGTVAVTWTYFKLLDFTDSQYYEYTGADLTQFLTDSNMTATATGVFSYNGNNLVMSLDLNSDGDYDDNMGGEPEAKDQETTKQ